MSASGPDKGYHFVLRNLSPSSKYRLPYGTPPLLRGGDACMEYQGKRKSPIGDFFEADTRPEGPEMAEPEEEPEEELGLT